MLLSRAEIQQNAIAFSERWQDESQWNEKSNGQNFVREFIAVFGVNAADRGNFEKPSGGGFADYILPKIIAVEMKSQGKDLGEAFRQLTDYVLPLPVNEMPDLLMVCDFENIALYRRTEITKKYPAAIEFKTKDLINHVDLFHELAGLEKHHDVEDAEDVNTKAVRLMAEIHNDLERHGYRGHDLEIYLVRLLFCVFAENTGIFPQHSFLSYVKNSKNKDLSGRIGKLFEILNMSDEERNERTLLSDELKVFRYIDGGLFEKLLPTADFDERMRQTLIKCCMFDWGKISPAIFGSMFQGIMDRNKRREIGAHYTSEENILKLIDSLFMDDLRARFNRVKSDERRLDNLHDEIAKLKFLDPACGCGNFLMIAYRELRKLEIEILRIKKRRQKVLDISVLLKVTVEQFYGIEIEDFPCEVARTSLWLMDHLMNIQVSKELGQYFVRLPLTKEGATIVHGNALRIDWEDVVPKEELSYILGNPPYNGARTMTATQKEDMLLAFGSLKKVGNLDYVAAWYKRAADMMTGTTIRTAFVSTNSITQGEQVAILWKPLMERGIVINHAYRTFKWTNEAPGKAAVHCVLIGFSFVDVPKYIFDGGSKNSVARISPYLVDAPDIFIGARSKPLCDVPDMVFGSMPNDGGHLIIEADEYKEFLRNEPQAKKFIRRFVGAVEYINNLPRYCLWLVSATPSELRMMPHVMRRIERVRGHRVASRREGTRKKASSPMLFGEVRQPETQYILIPRVSSERRHYIPIGFVLPKIIASDATLIIPNASLYHFGILTSSIHNGWTRAVCGRLRTDYRYSKDIVYNNFPWADATDAQKATIAKLAQVVLDARAKFPDSSLADLYDPLAMPTELLKAHQSLDRAVMKLYKFKQDMSESAIVAALMEMYQKLTAPPTFIPEPPKPRKGRKKGEKG